MCSTTMNKSSLRYRSSCKQISKASLEPESKKNTGRINRHAPSGWCVYIKFASGDVPDLLKAYRRKDCAEKFVDFIDAEVKSLHSLYPEQPMILLTGVMKREYEQASMKSTIQLLQQYSYSLFFKTSRMSTTSDVRI